MSFLHWVATLGVPADLPARRSRPLVVVNLLSVSFTLLAFLYAPILAVLASPGLGMCLLPLPVAFSMVPFLNVKGFHRASRLLLMIIMLTSVGCIIGAVADDLPAARVIGLSLFIFPLIVYAPDETGLMFSGLAMTVACLLFPLWTRFFRPSMPRVLIEHALQMPMAVGTATYFLVVQLLTVRYVFVKSDQSEQILSERYLRQNLHAENSRFAFVEFDKAGLILSWNPAAARIFGYTKAQAIGMPVAALVPPRTDSRRAEQDWIATAVSEAENRPISCVHKDGAALLIEATITAMTDSFGRTFGFAAIIQDVTVAAAIKARAEYSERLFSVTFQEAKFGLLHLNGAGLVLRCNAAFASMLGLPGAEACVGMDLKAFTHPGDVGKSRQIIGDLVAGRMESAQLEVRYLRQDGETLYVLLSTSVFRSRPGFGADSEDFLVAAVQNITEQKKLQAEIEAQQALAVNSAKMASLGEMAGGVAHEINNPLAIIHGRARRSQAKFQQLPEAVEAFAEIERVAVRITKIVKGLKNFARDGDNDAMEPSSIALVVGDAVELCREKIKNAGVELRLGEIPADLTVSARAVQLSQVVLNLLSNALDELVEKVAKDLPRWIALEAQDLGQTIEISVTDSGCGIPPEVLNKIMQPFFTTKPVGKGTGLGLSISTGIIASHGGRLFVDQSSKHTRFVVSLPKLLNLPLTNSDVA